MLDCTNPGFSRAALSLGAGCPQGVRVVAASTLSSSGEEGQRVTVFSPLGTAKIKAVWLAETWRLCRNQVSRVPAHFWCESVVLAAAGFDLSVCVKPNSRSALAPSPPS